MTKEEIAKEIDDWLKDNGHDREWLAKELNFSIGAIYNSFSKGFSKRTLASIRKLMSPPTAPTAGLEVKFTAEEFERIEQARKLLGMSTRKLYYEAAINEFTDDILKREQSGEKTPEPPNITHISASSPVNSDSPQAPANGTEG